jgi:transposase
MKKADIEKRKSLARTLFLSGLEQNDIAEKVGVSRVTVSKWATCESWKEQRAATQITRPELVNKVLVTIDNLLTQIQNSDDTELIAAAPDKLAKLAAVIQKLDKKANAIDTIEVFLAFSKWLEFRATTDSEITPELIKLFNKYQDKYILYKLGDNNA